MKRDIALLVGVVTFYVMNFSSLCCVEETSSENNIECSKEELMQFFPQKLVRSVLIKTDMSPAKVTTITIMLSQKDSELSRTIESESEKLDENLMTHVSQREAAAKIYRETLYQVFSKVMNENGITDPDQIQKLLDELQEARSKLFLDCIHGKKSPEK